MRVRKSRSEWSAIIEAFERSGGAHEAFCSKRGLNVGSFRGWLYRLRKAGAVVPEVTLVPVEMTAGAMTRMSPARPAASEVVIAVAELEVRVAVGVDTGYVGALVAELRSRC